MHLCDTNKPKNGYELLFHFFNKLEIRHFFGVTGGGVVHFLKYISPHATAESSFLTIDEYSAGYAPLGYFLSTGKIAACVSTLGAATKLLTCGLSDAKQHDIPSIYIVPAYDKNLDGKAPLQDSSHFGSNVINQLKSECPDGVFVFDHIDNIHVLLTQAEIRLNSNKPVVFVLIHSALSTDLSSNYRPLPLPNYQHSNTKSDLKNFINIFKNLSHKRKITVLVGEEMNLHSNAKFLISQLCEKIHPYLIWSMNGANAVSRDNQFGYGYLGFGGNDLANQHFNNLGSEDVLLVLGACPDEYTVNLQEFPAGQTFFCTNLVDGYGQVNGSYSHRTQLKYEQLNYPLELFIEEIIKEDYSFENIAAPPAPSNLNTRIISPPAKSYTNMENFYQRIDSWWPENSIAFSDVCLAYKDRQYVTQRPNDNIDFHALYRGSAMGYVLGAAVGSKIADMSKNVFAFTGDGCFKLFAGSLAEAAHLGITLFVLNNSKFSIVDQGLKTILPDTPSEFWHSTVNPIDYCLIAQACGWRAAKLNIDLSNLEDLLDSTLKQANKSLLIEITVDPDQLLGINPRVHNL